MVQLAGRFASLQLQIKAYYLVVVLRVSLFYFFTTKVQLTQYIQSALWQIGRVMLIPCNCTSYTSLLQENIENC